MKEKRAYKVSSLFLSNPSVFDNLEDPEFHPPPEPTPDEDGNTSRTEQAMRETNIKNRAKRGVKLQQSITVVLNVALGQCGAGTLSRVESSSRWEAMSRNKHGKGLADTKKSHCCHSS